MHVRSNKTISINHRSTDEVTVDCVCGDRGGGGFDPVMGDRFISKTSEGLHHFQVEILVSRC